MSTDYLRAIVVDVWFAAGSQKGNIMKKAFYALCAASTLALATTAYADPTVTVDTTIGQPLPDAIHSSKSNTVNDKVQVYGSTAQGAQSQNVLYTGGNTANVPITEATATAAGSTVGTNLAITDNGGGFAFVADSSSDGLLNFYDLIINPDQLFTDMKFAVQLTEAGTFDVYYLLSGSSTFTLASTGGNDISQAGKTNTNYLVDISGGTFDAIQIVSTVPIFQVEQMSINSVAAVPEPATWAMMLVGFGGIGIAMRRSRRRNNQMSFAQIA
jgi:hypothetical protein